MTDVAIVLPPRECFSPDGSGAVALLVHRLMRAPSRYRRHVIGVPCQAPFADVAFLPAAPRRAPFLGLGSLVRRYAAGVERVIGHPGQIEVHNKAALALHLAHARPDARVTLMLHNDPQQMRGLRTAHERRLVGRRLAGIACVSDYVAGRYRDGADDIRVSVLPNCIDLAAIPAAPAERNTVILFVGRLVEDKGADAFVAACRQILPQLPGWRAELIGATHFAPRNQPTAYVTRLTAAAEQAGVTMLGYRPHAAVLRAMTRAAIVVVPSRWQEPFGLTALEAMAAGAALVCSNRGGLREVAGAVALPCDPDDPATIAAAIRQLAAGPDDRTARGADGRARAALFDVALAAAALDLYRDAVGRIGR